jgi:hypothetical protein
VIFPGDERLAPALQFMMMSAFFTAYAFLELNKSSLASFSAVHKLTTHQ